MNIIEAAKINGTFYRNEVPGVFNFKDGKVLLSREDILATDWKIFEQKVTITLEQFNKACAATSINDGFGLFRTLAKNLGFKIE